MVKSGTSDRLWFRDHVSVSSMKYSRWTSSGPNLFVTSILCFSEALSATLLSLGAGSWYSGTSLSNILSATRSLLIASFFDLPEEEISTSKKIPLGIQQGWCMFMYNNLKGLKLEDICLYWQRTRSIANLALVSICTINDCLQRTCNMILYHVSLHISSKTST